MTDMHIAKYIVSLVYRNFVGHPLVLFVAVGLRHRFRFLIIWKVVNRLSWCLWPKKMEIVSVSNALFFVKKKGIVLPKNTDSSFIGHYLITFSLLKFWPLWVIFGLWEHNSVRLSTPCSSTKHADTN